MDRLNSNHISARVELPSSVSDGHEGLTSFRAPIKPATYAYMGIFAFFCCGTAVIIAANLLALSIQ